MDNEKFASCVYIILKKDGKVLLQRRNGTVQYNGFLAFPAGHIDVGENCYEAVTREAKEELDIDVDKTDIIDSFVDMRRSKIHGPYYDVYFEFKKYKGKIKINEPVKASELIWVDENNLPSDMVKFQREAYKMNKNGIKFHCEDVYVEE